MNTHIKRLRTAVSMLLAVGVLALVVAGCGGGSSSSSSSAAGNSSTATSTTQSTTQSTPQSSSSTGKLGRRELRDPAEQWRRRGLR